MTYLIQLLLIPLAATAISTVVSLWKKKTWPDQWENITAKPLDCAFCLSFWINVSLWYWIADGQPWYIGLLCAYASMTIATTINNNYDR